MIKIGAFSDDLAADFQHSVTLAQKLGLQGLELRNVWGKGVGELSAQDMHTVRQLLGGTGIQVTCLSSPYGRSFWIDDPEAKKQNEQVLQKMIRFSQILQVPLIRIFALWMPGYHGSADWVRRPVFTPELVAKLAEQMGPSVRMAERAGVTLALENEGASYGGTCCEVRQIVDALNSPAVRVCWDPCNGWHSGEIPYPDGYGLIRNLVCHFHAKDRLPRPDNANVAGERAIIGTGSLPHADILSSLLADGYNGWAVVEQHFHPRDPELFPELQARIMADIRGLQSILARVSLEFYHRPGQTLCNTPVGA